MNFKRSITSKAGSLPHRGPLPHARTKLPVGDGSYKTYTAHLRSEKKFRYGSLSLHYLIAYKTTLRLTSYCGSNRRAPTLAAVFARSINERTDGLINENTRIN